MNDAKPGQNGRQQKKATVDVYFYFGERTTAALATSDIASDNNALTLLARLLVGVERAA